MDQLLLVIYQGLTVLLNDFFLESPLVWLSLGVIIILLLVILAKSKWRKYDNMTLTTGEELADIIETFLDNTASSLDHENFEDIWLKDEHENLRQIVIDLPYTHPSTDPDQYCNDEGLKIMRQFIEGLRNQEV